MQNITKEMPMQTEKEAAPTKEIVAQAYPDIQWGNRS